MYIYIDIYWFFMYILVCLYIMTIFTYFNFSFLHVHHLLFLSNNGMCI